MLTTFLATLQPMLTLFLCIAIGFTLHKQKLLPDNAGKVIAKLQNWVFCPALSFTTMTRFFTLKTVQTHAVNLFFSCCVLAVAMSIAIPCAKLFVKEKGAYELGVYQYALAFGNIGYMGDPIVLALFGDVGLSYYKIFTLPLSIAIYTWGLSVLVPKDKQSGNPLKNMLNPPMIATFLGLFVGLVGLGGENGFMDTKLPFIMKTLDTLKTSMGPMAMLLAGFTIASYDLKKMLQNKKVYVATALRLVVIPTIIVTIVALVKLAVTSLGVPVTNATLVLCFIATAVPLGMNTIVFPEAYGGNPETGAAMATISHTLCIITIPILYAIMTTIFGVPIF